MPPADDSTQKRLEHLLELRSTVLDEMEETDAKLSRLRMRVEGMESDIRLGAEPTPEYDRIKGHDMPDLESRLVQLYGELTKLEDKIRAIRATG